MVMQGLARHVGVLAVWEVDPLDRADLEEQVERPEDRCPPDARAPGARFGGDVGRGEVAAAARGDQVGHRPAWPGQAISGTAERLHDAGGWSLGSHFGVDHAVMILGLNKCRPLRRMVAAGVLELRGCSG